MAREKLKKEKICLVCGEVFKATGKASTCSTACRTKLSRLKESGGKPEYCLLAKSKGQELPDWIVLTAKGSDQNSIQTKKIDKPAPEKESPKNENSGAMSYREQLFNKKMGIK